MKTRRIQLLILLLWPLAAAALSLGLHVGALASVLLFLGVPAVVASVGLPRRIISKLLLFTLVVAPATIIIVDYIAELNGTWQFFHSSIIPFRLLRFVTIEVIVWALLNIYAVVAFYERFFERHRTVRLFEPRLKHLSFFIVSLFLLFLGAYIKTSGSIFIPYFYTAFGTVLILPPVVLVLARRPLLAGKFFFTGAYFFYLCLAYEVTALRLGQWAFPSDQFLGWVSLAGIRFPFEEFFFWLMLMAMAVLACYEYFDDDSR